MGGLTRAVLAAASIGVLLAGCGSGDSTVSKTPLPTTTPATTPQGAATESPPP
ncbi:MAG: LppP/LprE family lipoprotein, partial [Mycobacterium sp.]